MPRRFDRLDLPGLPGVALDAIQVSLQRLVRLLNVKGSRGFDLSSAVVPVVDVTSLIESEGAGGNLDNAVSIDRAFNAAGIGPHAATERWRYTVPPRKKAILLSGNIWIMRATVPAVVGVAHGNIFILRAAAPGTVITIARQNLNSGTVGASVQANAPAGAELFEGDAIVGQTTDVSTGGTHEYDVTVALVEKDAG